MRLASFSVQGFQSYQTTQSVRIQSDLTILAGRNNVGKSALLRALRLPVAQEEGARTDLLLQYRWVLEPMELRQLIPLENFPNFQSALEEAARAAICTLEAELGHRVSAESYPRRRVPRPVESAVGNYEIRNVSLAGGALRLRLYWREEQSPPTAYLWWVEDRPDDDESYRLGRRLYETVAGALGRQYYISPRRATRRTEFVPTTALESDGANLTNVVGTLYTNNRHAEFRQLEEYMRDVFPEARHLMVLMEGKPPSAEIYVAFGRDGGLTVPLRHCGTGIEQAITLATAVLTAPPGYLFLIDEPHAFLHPFAERKVLSFLREHSEHQYIVATHSPVFLTSYPVDHARLVTMNDDGSRIADVGAHSAILRELGVTAADLWSAGSVLWVEGPSEVEVVRALMPRPTEGSYISVRAMPDTVRNSARGERHARLAVEFCQAVTEAILPVNVRMLFLFDADERREHLKDAIIKATAGRARFLPVRELENLLLSAPVLHDDVSSLCASFGLETPSQEDIRADIDDLLSQTDDKALYPVGVAGPDSTRVVGSEVLRRLYWKRALLEYDKVGDGLRLARKVRELEPDRLNALVDVIRELQG